MKRALILIAVVAGVGAPTASAARPAIDIDPTRVNFGSQPFESLTVESFTVTNRSSEPLFVRIDQIHVGDDFSPGLIDSTCTLTDERLLAAGESCIHFVSFRPSEFFAGREIATLQVTARDGTGAVVYTREVTLAGRGFAPR
jgi:hypothetical protein